MAPSRPDSGIMERMRWMWPWALALASLVGCKSQGPCLYTSFTYLPGQPGSERLSATVVLPESYHVVSVDVEKQRIAEEILGFLGALGAGSILSRRTRRRGATPTVSEPRTLHPAWWLRPRAHVVLSGAISGALRRKSTRRAARIR